MKGKFLASILSLFMVVSSLSPVTATSTRVEELLAGMTLRQKITQMMMPDFRKWNADGSGAVDFTVMNDQVSKIISDYDFGGIILFAQNIKETEQSYNLTMAMQEAATKDGGLPLLISADQEGGSVYRLGSGTALPGNMALGAASDEEYSYAAGQIIGSELSVLGINTNLAPVVDVNNNANNPVIGLRSYGDDATAVGKLASASIAGMAEYNVIGCAKHFPGHGDTETDSHTGLPVVDKTKEELLNNELKPFQVAIDQGIEMIMSAHIVYPQLDDTLVYSEKTGKDEYLPATLSSKIMTDLLKGEMGFKGIIITDAMNMAGISSAYGQVQATIMAVNAGVDMICMPCELRSNEDLADLDAIIEGLEAAVNDGTIPMERINDAVTRILTVKENRGILDYNSANYSLETALNTVGSEENRETEREIAAAAVTVVKNENNVLPLQLTSESKVLMLCPYNNERGLLTMAWNRAVEAGLVPDGATTNVVRFSGAGLSKEYVSVADPNTSKPLSEYIDWADTVIVVTEVGYASRMAYDHWLSAGPNNFTTYAKETGKVSVILSADKPYDVQLYPNADAIMAVYGCKGSTVDPTEALVGGVTGTTSAYGPNIIAGVEVALGTYGAQGKLPVNIPEFDNTTNTYTDTIVYERGYGLTYDAKVRTKLLKVILDEAAQLNEEEFTPASWAVLADAVATGTALLTDETATQEQVDAASAAIYEAMDELVVKADNTELNAAVNTEVKAEDYTKESYEAYLKALEAAESVNANPNATQEEVDAALAALKEAYAALVKAPVNTGDNTHIALYVSLSFVALAGLFLGLRKKEELN